MIGQVMSIIRRKNALTNRQLIDKKTYNLKESIHSVLKVVVS